MSSPQPPAPRSPHPTAELPGLVAGELAPSVAHVVNRHLSGCAACRHDLALVVAAAGALADAARLAADDPPVLPPLRRPAGAPVRRHRRTLAAVAAVAAVGIALVGLTRPWRTDEPAGVALRPVSADGVHGTARMQGSGDSQRMVVDVAGLAPTPAHFFEVWLLDPVHARTLAVGVLPDDGHGSYALPAATAAGYTALDVSVEPTDGNPAHSAVSVARGPL